MLQILVYPLFSVVFCNNGDLRLAGSTNIGQGRVEICINETWGTICDDSWGSEDAGVACRVLGFSRFRKTNHDSIYKFHVYDVSQYSLYM